MQQEILRWLPFYGLGLVGIVTHVVTKLRKGETIGGWIRANAQDFWLSVIAYHVLVFFWMSDGIEIFGMLKGTPTAMTFMLGWFGNSALGHFLSQVERRWMKKDAEPKPPQV